MEPGGWEYLMEHVDAKEYDRGGYRRIRYRGVDAPVGYLSVDRLIGDGNCMRDLEVISEEGQVCEATSMG